MNKALKRIAIVGNPGSGKSTFATRLGLMLNIPIHHMDTLVFVGNSKTAKQELIQTQKALVDQDQWIIEGCSISTLDIRFGKADLVIYLDVPRITCLWRVLKRSLTFEKNLAKSGCIKIPNWSLLKYIWDFEKERKPKIIEVKERYPQLTFLVLKSSEEIELFLKECNSL